MSEDVSRQLQHIADLLRRQVEVMEREQNLREEQRREQEHLLEKFTGGLPKFELPKFLEESKEQVRRLDGRRIRCPL